MEKGHPVPFIAKEEIVPAQSNDEMNLLASDSAQSTANELLLATAKLLHSTASYELRLKALEDKSNYIEKTVNRLDEIRKKAFYDQFKLFTYFIDKEFSIDQKKWFLQKVTHRALGYFIDLDTPKSFNEKVNWYKLFYQDPLITDCIDKFKMKDYVEKKLGKGFVAPLIDVWDNPANINLDSIEAPFYLKSTWGSGSRHVKKIVNIGNENVELLRWHLTSWLQPWENVYFHTFDWGYKDIEPRIIAEKVIDDIEMEIKFWCFYGAPKIAYVIRYDTKPHELSYFDMDWNKLPVQHGNFKNISYNLQRPENWNELLDAVHALSSPFPHVRVGFYLTKKRQFYIEELTFYTTSGKHRFNPVEWDYKFGDFFTLPDKKIL